MRCMGGFSKIDIFPLDVFSIYLPFQFFFSTPRCWERQMRKNVNETEGTGDLWRLPRPRPVFPLKDDEEGLGDPVFAYLEGVGSPQATWLSRIL